MEQEEGPRWRLSGDLDNENVYATLAASDGKAHLWLDGRYFRVEQELYERGFDHFYRLWIVSTLRLQQGTNTDPGVFILDRVPSIEHCEQFLAPQHASDNPPPLDDVKRLLLEGFLERVAAKVAAAEASADAS